jgi:hypothetical protein
MKNVKSMKLNQTKAVLHDLHVLHGERGTALCAFAV